MEQREENSEMLLRRVRFVQCRGALLIFIGCILMQIVAYIICVLGFGFVSQEGDLLIWMSAVSAVLCLIWCGALYRRSTWRQEKLSYRTALSKQRLSAICAASAGSCILLTVVITLVAAIMPEWFKAYQKMMSQLDVNSSVITLPYVLVIGPMSEEMIFRGAIFDRFRTAFPFWIANALQAAFFGLYHMNIIQGIYAFVLGLLLGMICQVTGTVLGSILAHIVFNLTSEILSVSFTGDSPAEIAVMGVLVLCAFAAVVWSVGYLRRELS